ncbi:MAG: hypothetical protein ACQER9_04715 [Nanobdellota archaeon]
MEKLETKLKKPEINKGDIVLAYRENDFLNEVFKLLQEYNDRLKIVTVPAGTEQLSYEDAIKLKQLHNGMFDEDDLRYELYFDKTLPELAGMDRVQNIFFEKDMNKDAEKIIEKKKYKEEVMIAEDELKKENLDPEYRKTVENYLEYSKNELEKIKELEENRGREMEKSLENVAQYCEEFNIENMIIVMGNELDYEHRDGCKMTHHELYTLDEKGNEKGWSREDVKEIESFKEVYNFVKRPFEEKNIDTYLGMVNKEGDEKTLRVYNENDDFGYREGVFTPPDEEVINNFDKNNTAYIADRHVAFRDKKDYKLQFNLQEGAIITQNAYTGKTDDKEHIFELSTRLAKTFFNVSEEDFKEWYMNSYSKE